MTDYNENVIDGMVYFNPGDLDTGKYYIRVHYLQNKDYKESYAYYTLYVNMDHTYGYLDTQNDIIEYYNDEIITVIAQFYLSKGTILRDGQVAFYIDNTQIGTGITNYNGQVMCSAMIDLDEEGQHVLLAELKDGSDYRGCTLKKDIYLLKHTANIYLDDLVDVYYEETFVVSGYITIEGSTTNYDLSFWFTMGEETFTNTVTASGELSYFSFDFHDQLEKLPKEFLLTVHTPGNRYVTESTTSQNVIIRERTAILCDDTYQVFTEGVTIEGRVARRTTYETYDLSEEVLMMYIPTNSGAFASPTSAKSVQSLNVTAEENRQQVEESINEYVNSYAYTRSYSLILDEEGNFSTTYVPEKDIDPEHEVLFVLPENNYHDGATKVVSVQDFSQTDIVIGTGEALEFGVYDTLEVDCSIMIGEGGLSLHEAYGDNMTYTCTSQIIEYTEVTDNIIPVFDVDNTFSSSSSDFSITGECSNDPTGGKRMLQVTITVIDSNGEEVFTTTAYRTVYIIGYLTAEFSDIYTLENESVTRIDMSVDITCQQNGGDVFSLINRPTLYMYNDDTGIYDLLCLDDFEQDGNVLHFEGSVPVNVYHCKSKLYFTVNDYRPGSPLTGYYYGTEIEGDVWIPQPVEITFSELNDENTVREDSNYGQVINGVDYYIYYFVKSILEMIDVNQGYLMFNYKYKCSGTVWVNISVDVDRDTVYVSETVTFKATFLDNMFNPIQDIDVDFYDNGSKIGTQTTINSGVVSRNITMTSRGVHTLCVYYQGDSIYVEMHESLDVNVEAIPSNLNGSLSQEELWIGETVTVTEVLTDYWNDPIKNAEIELYIDDVLVDTGVTNSDGEYTYDYQPQLVGEHVVRAVYNGSDSRGSASNTLTCEVKNNVSTMVLTWTKTDITMLETVTIHVKLLDCNEEHIDHFELLVYEDDKLVDVVDIDYDGSLVYTPTCEGTHSITVQYEGDGVHMGTSESFTVHVSKIETVLSVEPSELSCAWFEYTDFTTTLTTTDNEALEDFEIVTYEDDALLREDTTDGDGKVEWTYLAQRIAEYDLVVEYEGSEIYTSASKTIPVVVDKARSRITMNETPETLEYGETIDFVIHLEMISGDAYYNITNTVLRIYDNGELIKTTTTSDAGYIEFTYECVEAGEHEFTVRYDGNDYIYGCDEIVNFSVDKQVFEPNLEVNGHSSNYSEYTSLYSDTEFSIKLVDVGDCSELEGLGIDVYIDGVKDTTLGITNCSASWSHVFEEAGMYSVLFYFEGDETHVSCQCSVTVEVGDDRGTLTLIPEQLTHTIYYGDSVDLYGVIESDPVLTEEISFNVYDNGIYLETINSDIYGGEFGLNYVGNNIETHLISIVFEGDTNYKPTSTVITVTVIQLTTGITVVEGNSVSCFVTEPYTFNLQLTSNKGVVVNETITIIDGEGYETAITTDDDGYLQFTYTPSSVGTHTLIASYDGSYSNESCNSNISVTAKIIPTVMNYNSSESFTVGVNEIVTVGATVTEQYQGQLIDNAEFTVYDNDVQIGTTVNGLYEYNSDVIGSHTVKLVYKGSDIYDSSELVYTVDIISLDTSILVEGGITKTGYVTVGQDLRIGVMSGGEYLEGQVLDVYEGDTLLTTLETESDGYATYTYKDDTAGEHVLTVYYDGTGVYKECTETITITLSKIPVYTLDLSIPEDPCYYGQDETIVWQIYSDVTNTYKQSGTCQYYVDGEYMGDMSWYVNRPIQYSCVLNLACGTHTIKLVSLESGIYEELIEEFTLTILKRPTNMELTSDFTTLIQYNTYEFYVAILDTLKDDYLDNQTVQLYDNEELLGEYTSETSTIIIQWTPQDTGTHTIHIVYPETDTYDGCDLTFTLRVIPQYATEIELEDIPESIEYTEPLEITWKLKALNEDGSFKEYLTDEAGLMSIHRNNYKNNVKSNSNGYYYDYIGDTAGNQNFIIKYEGSDEYLPCNLEFLLVTTPMKIDVKYLSMTEEPWYVGDTVDLTFNVISTRTGETLTHYNRGEIIMYDYSTPQWLTSEDTNPVDIGDGTWQVSIVFEKAKTIDWGAYIMPISGITMELEEPQLTNTIYKKGTEIELIDIPSDVSVGEQFRIQCKLRSLDVNGSFIEYLSGEEVTITFEDNKENMNTSSNSYYKDYTLNAGSYSFFIEYEGNDKYDSCSTTWNLNIEKFTPKIYTEPSPISSTERRVAVADGFAVRLEYTDNINGIWEFPDLPIHVFDDDEELTVGEMNEQGNRGVDWTPTTAGDHTIRIVSDESDTYYSAEYTETVTVEKGETRLVPNVTESIGYYEEGTSYGLLVYIYNALDEKINCRDLLDELIDSEDSIIKETKYTDTSGVYIWEPTVGGDHILTMSFKGDDNYLPCEKVVTLIVKYGTYLDIEMPSQFVVNENAVFYCRIYETATAEILSRRTILFYVDDEFIYEYVYGNQITIITINWTPDTPGEHELRFVYAGDDYTMGCEVTKVVNVDDVHEYEYEYVWDGSASDWCFYSGGNALSTAVTVTDGILINNGSTNAYLENIYVLTKGVYVESELYTSASSRFEFGIRDHSDSDSLYRCIVDTGKTLAVGASGSGTTGMYTTDIISDEWFEFDVEWTKDNEIIFYINDQEYVIDDDPSFTECYFYTHKWSSGNMQLRTYKTRKI